jgi:uncharacterized protein YdeI (YjbR/CyaY-like superfamily)
MPKSFKTPRTFRAWLEKHHDREQELVLRLFKVHALEQGIGYRQALDEALCWGWIDGVVRRLDDDSFQQRFTPRTAKSNWSAVNIKRMKQLIADGRVAKPGLAAFARRGKTRPSSYSPENRDLALDPALVKRFRAEPKAWAFFTALPPGFRRLMIFRVMTGKRAATRERRFADLLGGCRKGKRMPLI